MTHTLRLRPGDELHTLPPFRVLGFGSDPAGTYVVVSYDDGTEQQTLGGV